MYHDENRAIFSQRPSFAPSFPATLRWAYKLGEKPVGGAVSSKNSRMGKTLLHRGRRLIWSLYYSINKNTVCYLWPKSNISFSANHSCPSGNFAVHLQTYIDDPPACARLRLPAEWTQSIIRASFQCFNGICYRYLLLFISYCDCC